jgi:signal transduction histidine kinase
MPRNINFFWLVILLLFLRPPFLYTADLPITAQSHNQSAYAELKKGNHKQAFIEAKTAQTLALEENNTVELARAISNIASTHLYFGEYDKALKMYLESLEISKKDNNLDGIERALNNISAVYVRIDRSAEAIAYLLKLPILNGIERSPHDQLVGYISLASRYRETGNSGKAYQFINKAKHVAQASPEPFLEVYLFLELAKLKKADGLMPDAIHYLQRALIIARDKEFSELRAVILKNLADVYFHFKDFHQAKIYAKEAFDFSVDLELLAEQQMILEYLIKIERILGNYKEALEYVDTNSLLTESVRGQKIQQLAEITKIDRLMAETEEKLKLSLQKAEIAELKYERHKQMQLNTTIIMLVVIALVSFWFYRRNSQLKLLRQIEKNTELKELDILKDRILTNTSHELRTPLNGIIGLSDAILMNTENRLDEDTKRYIELIGKSGTQLSEIINDILDLAQLRANKMVFNNSKFLINSVIEEVSSLCQPLVNNSELKIKLELLEKDCELYLDEKRVRQILFNIIGNAIKFTEQGFVKIMLKKFDNTLHIIVEDTGIGIPKNKIKRVFEGFEQVNQGNTREHGGSGLGLAICNQLLSALGGTISASSELSKGTVMTIELPVDE